MLCTSRRTCIIAVITGCVYRQIKRSIVGYLINIAGTTVVQAKLEIRGLTDIGISKPVPLSLDKSPTADSTI